MRSSTLLESGNTTSLSSTINSGITVHCFKVNMEELLFGTALIKSPNVTLCTTIQINDNNEITSKTIKK
jgi:hypothetical protein